MSAAQSHGSEHAALARSMPDVARALCGEPNAKLSSHDELRYGTRGSLSIDITKGVYHDYETGEGGGVIDLVRREKRCDLPTAMAWLSEHGHIPKMPPTSDRRVAATYRYVDADGQHLYSVIRYEPKDFRQRRADGSWKMGDVKRVLYRLPEVIAAVQQGVAVYIVEGEKAADRLAQMGLVATCSPGGAGKWRKAYGDALVGADVVVLPDNDEAGANHARDITNDLHDRAGRLRVLALPGLAPKGDVFDWLQGGGTADELMRLAADAPDVDAVAPGTTEQPGAGRQGAVNDLVEEFNGLYHVVNEAGRVVIYQPGFDPVLKRQHFDRISFEDLTKLYLNRMIEVGTNEKGDPIYKNAAQIWLRHPRRKQYIGGVVFDPSGQDTGPDTLNLWKGFAFEPKPGDWSLLRAHIRDVLCGGNAVYFEYLLGWMARLMQFPAEQGEVAVVMKGGEGTGKGTLARALLTILGQHGMAISNSKHLVGGFNGHLRDAVLLFADEAFFAGDKQHVGTLKSLITEPYLTIEAKYQTAVQQPNFLHVMMASNEEWVVPASVDSRRFFVLEVLGTVANNHTYFAQIWKQMKAGGYQAMLHDLLAYDLTTFDVRSVPVTEGLQGQRKLSLPTPEAWWQDCLARGYVFRSKYGLESEFHRWMQKVSTELLYSSYSTFAKSRGERHPFSIEQLGHFMRKMGCKPGRLTKQPAGERMADVVDIYGNSKRLAQAWVEDRPHGYSIGDLQSARDAFTAVTGLSVNWDDGSEDDA